MTRPELVLRLLPPPSVNNLFVNVGRRRVKSPRYRAWLQTAGWQLLTQRQGCVGGPWQAEVVLPAGLRGDADNYSKAILDLLVAHRVVDDDRHCRRLTIEKTGDTGQVLVTIKQHRGRK